jgi:hypothetical protein
MKVQESSAITLRIDIFTAYTYLVSLAREVEKIKMRVQLQSQLTTGKYRKFVYGHVHVKFTVTTIGSFHFL